MVKQIDKYWEKLFADPIMVTTANGEKILVQPQRPITFWNAFSGI